MTSSASAVQPGAALLRAGVVPLRGGVRGHAPGAEGGWSLWKRTRPCSTRVDEGKQGKGMVP